jgi:hypothetical protein
MALGLDGLERTTLYRMTGTVRILTVYVDCRGVLIEGVNGCGSIKVLNRRVLIEVFDRRVFDRSIR